VLSRLLVCDFSCFFMSICRDVQHAVERKIGVRPEVTDVTFALQAATLMRYDTGAGLTEGVIGARGVGQGTVDGPRRSTLLLAQMQRAVEQLCAGFSHSAHCRAEGLRVPYIFFADDGGFGSDTFAMLQLVFDVISTVARAQGLTISVKSDGSKTAWTGLEFDPHSGEWHTCDDGRRIELVDGTTVPRVNWYKHLGSVIGTDMLHELVRDCCVRRCCAVLAALARIGVLSLLQFEQAADAAVNSVIGYYGRATPIGMEACEQIEAARRRGMAANGHRSYNGSKEQTYDPLVEGGAGVRHSYAVACAALVDQIDRALCGVEGRPDRTAVEAAIAQTCVRLGYVATALAPTPLDWWPLHLLQQGALSEEFVIEAWLLYRLEAGLASPHTGVPSRGALGHDKWQLCSKEENVSLWERPGRTFSRRLAARGICRRRDILGPKGEWARASVIASRFGGTLTTAELDQYHILLSELDVGDIAWRQSLPAVPVPAALAATTEPKALHILQARRIGMGLAAFEYVVHWSDNVARGWVRRGHGRPLATRLTMALQREAAAAEALAGPCSLREHLHTQGWDEERIRVATSAPQEADAPGGLLAQAAVYDLTREMWSHAQRSSAHELGIMSNCASLTRRAQGTRWVPSGRQQLFLGSVVRTGERRQDGWPQRRAVPSLERRIMRKKRCAWGPCGTGAEDSSRGGGQSWPDRPAG
jgi:hypothetical protein